MHLIVWYTGIDLSEICPYIYLQHTAITFSVVSWILITMHTINSYDESNTDSGSVPEASCCLPQQHSLNAVDADTFHSFGDHCPGNAIRPAALPPFCYHSSPTRLSPSCY